VLSMCLFMKEGEGTGLSDCMMSVGCMLSIR